MAKFTLSALAAAVLLGTANAAFKTACNTDWDICGWALQSNFGYDQNTLLSAASAANQDAGTGSIVYDSIYNCYPNGEIVWSAWCGGGGLCNPQPTTSSHATCKGEPVDTGRAPPSGDGSASGSSDGSSDGGYIEDPPIDPNTVIPKAPPA